jgi:RHS repeat-associated protein
MMQTAFHQTRNDDNDIAIDYIGGLDYSVDVLGNITQIADAAGGNHYQYDTIDRLTKVINSNTLTDVTAFTYDKTGNRLSKKVGTAAAQTYTYPTTNHRLSNDSTFARTYDANGNTTRSATAKYFTYDARNRLVDFRTGSAASTIVSQYQFNGKGERVRKYKGAIDQARYLYNENGQLLAQDKIIAGTTYTQEMIWLDDMPIGVSQGGSMYGILTDHLNTPRRIFNTGTQLTAWSWNAVDDAFGESAAVASGLEFDLRFAGQFFDVESGLHYNYLRDGYESQTGRYTQSDPIGLAGGISTYGYVGGNPLFFIDPKGLYTVRAFGNRGNGYGWEWEYVIEFDPIDAKKIPGIGGKIRQFGDRLGLVINAMKPSSAGPNQPYKEYLECGILDSELKGRYADLGFEPGQRLTRKEASEILYDFRRRHKETKNLYPKPSVTLDEALSLGKENWMYKWNEYIWGPEG